MNDSDVVRQHAAAAPKFPSPFFRRPIVAVDLDNTCFDYTAALRLFAAEWIRTHHPRRNHITADHLVPYPSWNAAEWGITPDEFYEIERYAIENGLFTVVEPMPGVVDALNDLVAAGYEIRYLTGRRNDNEIPEETHLALMDRGFPEGAVLFISRHFGNASKSMVHADLFIEDNPRNLEEFAAMHLPHIVYDRVYNRAIDAKHRVTDWSDMLDEVARVIGPVILPPDPSFKRDEVSAQCVVLSEQLDQVIARIAALKIEPLPRVRGRETRATREAHDERLRAAERDKSRLEDQLEHAEGRLAHLNDMIRQRDAVLAEYPGLLLPPSERDLDRKSRAISDRFATLEASRKQLEAEREHLRQLEANLEERKHIVEDGEQALDIERRALGLSDRNAPVTTSETSVPTLHLSYGSHVAENPGISIILGSSIAHPVAEAKVRKLGYRIVGQRVNAKTPSGSITDIDILAMRDGIEGDELHRALSNLRSEFNKLPQEDVAKRQALTQELLRLERDLYLCVEVKWGDGSLSRSQRELYEALQRGGTVEIISDLHDRGAESGILRNVPFAASPLVVRVGMKVWEAWHDSRRLRTERQRGAEGRSNEAAPELVIDLRPEPAERPAARD